MFLGRLLALLERPTGPRSSNSRPGWHGYSNLFVCRPLGRPARLEVSRRVPDARRSTDQPAGWLPSRPDAPAVMQCERRPGSGPDRAHRESRLRPRTTVARRARQLGPPARARRSRSPGNRTSNVPIVAQQLIEEAAWPR